MCALVCILLAAAVLRVLAILPAFFNLGIAIQHDDFFGLARSWASTGAYPDPVFTPLYIALCKALLGLGDQAAGRTMLLIQGCASLATVALVYRIAIRLQWRRHAALGAATLVAIDPILLLYTPLFYTETIFLGLAALAVALSLEVRSAGSWPILALLVGVVLGAAILTRAMGVWLVPVVLAVMLTRTKPLRWVGATACVLVGSGVLVLPWCSQNERAFGHFAISSSGPYNVAAVFLGKAKSDLDARPKSSWVSEWSDDVDPALYVGRPFEYAGALKQASLKWGRAHPVFVAKEVVRGQARAWLGPASGHLESMFPNSPATVRSLEVAVVCYRTTLILGFIAGLVSALRRRRLPDTCVLISAAWAVFVVLPSGSGGYSRFSVPALPAVHLVTASSIRERRKEQPERIDAEPSLLRAA